MLISLPATSLTGFDGSLRKPVRISGPWRNQETFKLLSNNTVAQSLNACPTLVSSMTAHMMPVFFIAIRSVSSVSCYHIRHLDPEYIVLLL